MVRPGTVTPVGPALRCALVNNMPDSALLATEQQFVGLLEAGAGRRAFEVRRYGMAGIPRGARTTAYLAEEYLPLEGLWDDEPDAVIVTGSEPLAASLSDEPYWPQLVALLADAATRPTSLLLSCLAAHAALLALDGLDRMALPGKCSGVFVHTVTGASTVTDGLHSPVLIPHSRYNEIPTAAVVGAGWQVVLQSPVGWGAIRARRGAADLLLVQGHPEYEPTTLLREYRRDIGRYLRRERTVRPGLPRDLVCEADRPAIEAFHRAALTGPPDARLLDTFPWDEVGARTKGEWRGTAEKLYTNWIDGILANRPARDLAGPAER
jgi:homoserine O-succinyltransferase